MMRHILDAKTGQQELGSKEGRRTKIRLRSVSWRWLAFFFLGTIVGLILFRTVIAFLFGDLLSEYAIYWVNYLSQATIMMGAIQILLRKFGAVMPRIQV